MDMKTGSIDTLKPSIVLLTSSFIFGIFNFYISCELLRQELQEFKTQYLQELKKR
jgi:hypothetical protein